MRQVLPIFAVLFCSGFALQSKGAPAFTNSLDMKMVRIEPGTFQMGNPHAELDSWDEQPVHKVTIRKPFYISEMEVTIEQFQQFRPEYLGSLRVEPYVTGLSWHDAVAFCEWLSKKEGKPYRLPTEAEWEYAARAGIRNMNAGPAEWCHDWYGPYPYEAQVDPVGPEEGMSRVVRGGGLDRWTSYYTRPHNRASQAPAFAMMKGTKPVTSAEQRKLSDEPTLPGLIGLWYGKTSFENPKNVDHIVTLDMDWDKFQQPGQDRSSMWSAKWEGVLEAPATGEISFHVSSDYAVRLVIDGESIVEWDGGQNQKSGSMALEKGKKYPIQVSYVHNRGDRRFVKIEWSWHGRERTPVAKDSLWHSKAERETQKDKVAREILPGHHNIGFRVVQAPPPESKPYRSWRPFIRECIVQDQPMSNQVPDPDKPWFRKRDLVSIPPDNVPQEESIAVGLFPGFMPHIHNPGLEVCPNGDVLAVFFTAKTGPGGEDRPEVSLAATRLRFGANMWDMPESFIDFADLNDTSSMLWKQGRTIYCFWGHAFHDCGYPFRWISSGDNGATWSDTRFPQFVGEIGPHTNQPINSAIRTADGTFYLPCDGIGGTSVLWTTKDNMKTWYDPGGRTFGRHTTCVLLKDGRILGMGGKHTDMDGYMPKSISGDGGKTWETSKTPFCEQGTQQRPTLIRLRSGRLFFAGDFQHREGYYPEAIKQRGAYVALSDDEGQTWHIKKLAGTLPYDDTYPYINKGNPHDTIGYSVARQAPNGIIHLIGTTTHPNQHWELNEAWILDDNAGYLEHKNPRISNVKQFEQRYPSGKVQARWSGTVTQEGEYRLHGKCVWYYENGNKHWELTYKAGSKVGDETYWDPKGKKVWTWIHNDDDTKVWAQYYVNGEKRYESTWRYFRAEAAKCWNIDGKLISESEFAIRRLKTTYVP